MAAILQTAFSNAFLWMKSFLFWFKFHFSLFLGKTVLVQVLACRQIGDKPLAEPMPTQFIDAYMLP